MASGAQTQLFTKKAQIFVSEETADNDTYITQVAGEAILAEIGDTPYTVDGDNYSPSSMRGDFLSQDEVPGLASTGFTFRVPCHGSGTAGTAPEFADALMACGMREELVAATSVTYFPYGVYDAAVDAVGPPIFRNPWTSYSVTLLEDGVAYRMKGAYGNVVLVGEVGMPLFLEFTMTGAYQAIGDDALESVSYDTAVSPTFVGATFEMNFGGAVTPKGINNFTLDCGNTIAVQNDINDAAGVYGARITDRKSFGSFDPEMVLSATANSSFYALARAGTTGTLTTGVVGGTAGNKWEVDVNRCVMRPIEMQNRENVRALTVPFAVSSAGTDAEGTNLDWSLQFT